MSSYGAEAIVLRKSNFGEADQVVTLLTKYHGKVSAVAKGVRRMGSRKGGNLDLFNHVKTYLAEGKSLDIITEVELLSAWPNIKKDLEKVSLAYQIIEPVNGFLTESQENQSVFDLTLQALNLLEHGPNPDIIVQVFHVKLLSQLGFQPELEHCVRCGGVLVEKGLAISGDLGGIIGPEEREFDVTAYPVSVDVVKTLRYFQSVPVEQAVKLILPTQVAREVSRSLQYYLEYLLEKDLKSPQLLRDVRKLNG